MQFAAAPAYFGRSDLRDTAIAEMEEHKRLDQIVKGTYGDLPPTAKNFRGCMIGCLGGKKRHEGCLDRFNFPIRLSNLFDAIFEGLPDPDHIAFTTDALSAINPGADLSMVAERWIHWLLTAPEMRLIELAEENGKKAIKQVAGLYARRIAADEPTMEEWDAAWAAAWDAAGAAAGDAAWAAAGDAAGAAAWDAAWKTMAAKLLVLLSEAE
jgi:hypothetical protein